jgi:uncharacterized protein YndB with AHSA1/START domain
MPITSVSSDPAKLTLTVVADYPVSVERLWEAYADPRQLERFWGPETWPATFTRHDMAVGGYSHYYMTGPDGITSRGWWKYLAVEPGRRLELEDGFADEQGKPNEQMPTMRMVFAFAATASGSRFESVTTFPSMEAMEQLVTMGMEDGMRSAMGQIDAVLADLATFAASRAVEAQLLSDTQVRVSRVIRGSVADVWRAHTEPALMKRWLLGPIYIRWRGGHGRRATLSGSRICAATARGELRIEPPYRAVTTERDGMEGPARQRATLVRARGDPAQPRHSYPAENRDMVSAPMTGGMA